MKQNIARFIIVIMTSKGPKPQKCNKRIHLQLLELYLMNFSQKLTIFTLDETIHAGAYENQAPNGISIGLVPTHLQTS